jgi:hypothetical protein
MMSRWSLEPKSLADFPIQPVSYAFSLQYNQIIINMHVLLALELSESHCVHDKHAN